MTTLKRVLLFIVPIFFLCFDHAYSVGSLTKESKGLRDKYHEIEARLMKNDLGIPIYIESVDENNAMRCDIYGIIDHSFDEVQREFREPANWCDIVLLHLNIKACTYWRLNNIRLLTLYGGRKYYEPPEDTYQLKYVYRITAQQPEYLHILLTADEGPLDTKNHRIKIEAMPLEKGRTFIHFNYGYIYGKLLRTVMKGYLATLGRKKIGFNVVNTDDEGKPVYVRGIRGMIERNSIRYYLAIKSYMDTLKYPEDKRFERRIRQWYDLTDQYRKQLFEIKREKYLKNKRQELQNQLKLQMELNQ